MLQSISALATLPAQGSTPEQQKAQTTNTSRNGRSNTIALTEYRSGLAPMKPWRLRPTFPGNRDNLRHPVSTSRHVIWWRLNAEADRCVFQLIARSSLALGRF